MPRLPRSADLRPPAQLLLLALVVVALALLARQQPVQASCPFAHLHKGSTERPASPGLQVESALAPHPSLEALNRYFRSMYAEAKPRLLSAQLRKQAYLISMQGSTLVLENHQNTSRLEVSTVNQAYQNYKAVCHSVLVIYMTLEEYHVHYPGAPVELPATVLDHVKQIHRLIVAAIAQVPSMGFPDSETQELQLRLLQAGQAYAEHLLDTRKFDLLVMQAFMGAIRLGVQRNLFLAAKEQLSIIDRTVMDWKQRFFTAETWAALKVVISSGHMDRAQHIGSQYFSRILGTDASRGERIIYSENPDAGYIRNLFATHVVDWGIGEAFFGRGDRMHMDALAEGAAEYLDILYPRP